MPWIRLDQVRYVLLLSFAMTELLTSTLACPSTEGLSSLRSLHSQRYLMMVSTYATAPSAIGWPITSGVRKKLEPTS